MGTYGTYAGTMDIPEEKKELFATQMATLLNQGGMMEFETVSMYGKKLGLLKPIEILPGGEVSFHFNYFEDEGWETAGFDADKCILWSEKIGSGEFDDVIMAGYTLYEAYMDDVGYACRNGDIINRTDYMGWINHVLGTDFSMKHRFRLWEFAERTAFVKMEDDDGEERLFEESDLKDFIPQELVYAAGGVELTDLLYIINGTDDLTVFVTELGTYPDDVRNCKEAVEAYLKNSGHDMKKLGEFLKKDRVARTQEKDPLLTDIAELSLMMPARVFVYLAAEKTEDLSFWREWKQLKDVVYRDEQMKPYAPDELLQWRKEKQELPISPVRTSEFLRRDGFLLFWDTPEELKGKPKYHLSDDDRLYWWDGSDGVIISEETDAWLKELAGRHTQLKESGDFAKIRKNFMKYFFSLLADIDDYYKRIYPFQNMFYEFLQNSDRAEYLAAILLLKELADSENYRREGALIKYVRASGWDISNQNVVHNFARIHLKRYLSVMANTKLREKYFRF